ncbi:MAG: phosphate signaling complex protein PhoU [Romboutsia timonensis]|uniref:phosphate signaling complex protein PhoU n=1 Tax=Romboutsia timonensis TaxID=1776391 RepID=UPI002A747599|nr:phosphate signaling complex protein PhoU [Romboutsia timonensis]MDY3000704.1 phosphate signaling complex protein PhoU [Romboutsia timonensis]
MLNTNLGLSIDTLKQYTINMIEECVSILDLSVECMLKQDIEACKKVIKQDDKIDELREYIRDRSIELLVLKQPMARNLRYIYALGFIALELERIGDYAVNIAEETIKICQDEYIKDLIDIPKMYEECKKMILEVKESLENENEDLAREIALQDDKIDSLYNRVQEDCLRVMNANPQTINQGVNLLFIGRYLERIGDHITNICEMIIFAINGEMTEIG